MNWDRLKDHGAFRTKKVVWLQKKRATERKAANAKPKQSRKLKAALKVKAAWLIEEQKQLSLKAQ